MRKYVRKKQLHAWILAWGLMTTVLMTPFTVSVAADTSGQNNAENQIVTTAHSLQHREVTTQAIFPIVVATDTGKVQGEVAESAVRWRGIPFAIAPRWAEPQSPDKWTGIKETTAYGTRSMHVAGGKLIGSDTELNLDVYRPNTKETNLPVLFYIHGGNNQTGGSSEFDGTTFASRANAVVVSINHRLGILGFADLPALKTGDKVTDSGNFALLDINKGLDWTIKNIKSFGGNPKNITIAGFSSGGRDVMAMTISPLFLGKYQKAIAFHGGLTTSAPSKAQLVDATALAPFAVEDGKAKDLIDAKQWVQGESKEVRDWLFSLSSEQLAKAFGGAGIRMAKFPHLFTDGQVLPADGFSGDNYTQTPIIMLTGYDEFSYHAGQDSRFVQAWKDKSLLQNQMRKAEYDFVKTYGSQFYRYFNTEESALKMAPHYNAPIYTTTIKWGADASIVGRPMAELVGAHHGIFLPLMTEKPILSSDWYPEAFSNTGVKELSQKFQAYMRNFLHTGNPNGKGLPRWEPWSAIGASDMIFDADANRAKIEQSFEHDSAEKILARIKADTTLTESQKLELIQTVMNGRWWSESLDKAYKSSDFWIH